MEKPKNPPDEAKRLEALRRLKILDTAPEERFDRLTRLAKNLLGVPIALVSLIDADRQWFKSRQGLDALETPRDISFCGHAILGNGPFLVSDASKDPRFADNPLVTSAPDIRFYAGVPLRLMSGQVMGTLCVIDKVPRVLDEREVQILTDLGVLVSRELETVTLEEALADGQAQEAKYRMLLDETSDLIQSVAPDGRLLYANKAMLRTLGYAFEDVLKLNVFDLIAPESREHCAVVMGRVLKGEACDGLDVVFMTKAGARVQARGRASGYFENGKATYTRGIFRDITVQTRTERRLAAQFAATRALSEAGTWREGLEGVLRGIGTAMGWKAAGAWEVDHDGAELYCADFWSAAGVSTEFTRQSREIRFARGVGLPGRTWAAAKPTWIGDVTADADFPRAKTAALDGVKMGVAFPILLDGKVEGVLEFFADSITSPDEELLQLFTGVGRQMGDFLRRRRADRVLQAVLDNATQVSIIATDTSGNITVFNKGAENLLGYSAAEMLGKSPALLHLPEEVAGRGKVLSMEAGHPVEGFGVFVEFARRGQFETREWTYVRKDRTTLPVSLSVTALRDRHGLVSGYLGIAVDITSAKAAQDALAKARDAALGLAKAKAEFLANMSHEIRTPMNAVIGMTGLLLDTSMTPQQREFSETIRNAGESLMAIIGDILDFSKIEAGGMPLEILDFSPRLISEEVTMLFAARAQDKGLEIAAVVDESLPPRLRGDAGRLRQILSNFVSNAIKFTDKGEVAVRVRRLADEGGSVRLRFEVRDTGIGLDADAKAKLFTAFTQADASTTRKYGGTGLGLAISKKLVELMKGEIGVDSAPGKGSTFWFELSLEKGSEVPLPAVAEVEGVRVLIVDDNATNREIVTSQAASWRMRPHAVPSADAALEELRRAAAQGDPFLLSLIDMQMPGMDGAGLAAAIKGDPAVSGTKLILLSSMSAPIPREELPSRGFDGSLTKPVRKSALFDAISNVLSSGAFRSASAPPQSAVAPRAAWRSLRILIAEDNAVNQKVALLQLQKLGCKADAVANGREAVAALAAIPYDLVLMDCQMPEMDGFEATAAIRKQAARAGRRTVIIAMTANALEGDRERCLAAGMDDYVAKPVRIEDLSTAIGRWFGSIDPVALQGLRELGDEGVVRDLIDVFLRDCGARLAGLRAAARTGDAAEIERLGHTLKGGAGTIGATGVQEISARLEAMGRSKALEGAEELVEALDGEIAAAARQLSSKLLGKA